MCVSTCVRVPFPPRRLRSFKSIARRLAFGRAVEGPLAVGRERCPFYCLRTLRLRNLHVADGVLLAALAVCPLLLDLDISHDKGAVGRPGEDVTTLALASLVRRAACCVPPRSPGIASTSHRAEVVVHCNKPL